MQGQGRVGIGNADTGGSGGRNYTEDEAQGGRPHADHVGGDRADRPDGCAHHDGLGLGGGNGPQPPDGGSKRCAGDCRGDGAVGGAA